MTLGRRAFCCLAVAALALGWGSLTSTSVSAQATLRIDATNVRGPVRRDVFGVNLEALTEDMPEIDELLEATPIIRYPGGDADQVHLWTDTDPGPCEVPQVRWPAVAERAARLGLGLYLETNLVRGTADDAVAWVQDARARGLRVEWVGIGNEVWGSFDAGFRTPSEYAADVATYAAALRAAYPEVKIVLSIGTFNEESWNREALRLASADIDAVDYHYYPNKREEPVSLEVAAGADGIGPLVSRIRAMIADEAPEHADRIAILLGEWDGAADPPRYPAPLDPGRSYALWSMADALFYGAAIGEMLEHGVAAAFYYELSGYRFGAVRGSAPPFCITTDYTVRRPKELAIRLWRERFGDQWIGVEASGIETFHSDGPTSWDGFEGDAPFVRAYASIENDDGSLRVVIVNRHPTDAIPLALSLVGLEHDGTAQVWELTGDSIDATNENVGGPPDAVAIDERTATLDAIAPAFDAPAHSVVVLAIQPRGASCGTCPPPQVCEGDRCVAGPPADAGAPQDSGTPRDTGATLDPDATTPPAPPARRDDGGCGCAVAGARDGSVAAWAASLVVAAACWRRRRRR